MGTKVEKSTKKGLRNNCPSVISISHVLVCMHTVSSSLVDKCVGEKNNSFFILSMFVQAYRRAATLYKISLNGMVKIQR